jgi:hypothetical protein
MAMSYEYLKKSNVYPFRLSKEIGRINERNVELSSQDEQRVQRIHREAIIIDRRERWGN